MKLFLSTGDPCDSTAMINSIISLDLGSPPGYAGALCNPVAQSSSDVGGFGQFQTSEGVRARKVRGN
jgi:hypothetical protein